MYQVATFNNIKHKERSNITSACLRAGSGLNQNTDIAGERRAKRVGAQISDVPKCFPRVKIKHFIWHELLSIKLLSVRILCQQIRGKVIILKC